jgi:hypothetical protein
MAKDPDPKPHPVIDSLTRVRLKIFGSDLIRIRIPNGTVQDFSGAPENLPTLPLKSIVSKRLLQLE